MNNKNQTERKEEEVMKHLFKKPSSTRPPAVSVLNLPNNETTPTKHQLSPKGTPTNVEPRKTPTSASMKNRRRSIHLDRKFSGKCEKKEKKKKRKKPPFNVLAMLLVASKGFRGAARPLDSTRPGNAFLFKTAVFRPFPFSCFFVFFFVLFFIFSSRF
jgi:hypothetical protein